MSDGFRPTLPRPSQQYDINDQMNLRREIQRALDFKANKNEAGGGSGGGGYAKLEGGNTFDGEQVFNDPVTVGGGFDPNTPGTRPALTLKGAFGGGIALDDAGTIAGMYAQELGK